MIAVCKDRSVKVTVKGREEDVVEYGDEDEDGEWREWRRRNWMYRGEGKGERSSA